MKRIFEWIGGFGLIAFSFYFTDQVSLLVASKSELMNEIIAVSANYREDAIDAKIDEKANTIIPGKYGREINSRESYLKMHEFGAFNENYLVYDYIKPNKSLTDNKDKYIISGNTLNRKVSIIIEDNSLIEEYLDKENIKYSIIATDLKALKNDREYINGASDDTTFYELQNKTSKICIHGYSDLKSCQKKKYYIIKPNIILGSSNIADIKSHISSGSIILISAKAKIEHISLLLNEIKYKDLKVVSINDLISET